MQNLRKSCLAAAGLALVIGGCAYAASQYTHHLQVTLADGEVAQVDYVGDIAPRVVMQPIAVAQDPLPDMLGFGSVDQIMVDLARQHAAMMQQVAQMQADMAAQPAGVPVADQHTANGVHWSYVSTTTTSNGCTRTVEWHTTGAQAEQPQVIRTSSGTCDTAVNPAPVHDAADVKSQVPAPAGKVV
jgi:hypothetical protein